MLNLCLKSTGIEKKSNKCVLIDLANSLIINSTFLEALEHVEIRVHFKKVVFLLLVFVANSIGITTVMLIFCTPMIYAVLHLATKAFKSC